MLVERTRQQMLLRRYQRWGALLAVAAILLGAIFFGDVRDFAIGRYRDHRMHRALTQAKSFVDEKDLSNALLALQIAVQANPDNPDAWRLAATTLEAAGSSQAIRVRQQILRAQPTILANQLALAQTALRFDDLVTAEASLALVSASDSKTAEALKLTAALALAEKHSDSAETALDSIVALEPGNTAMRFNLAVVRLRHADRTIAEAAQRQLAIIAVTEGGPRRADALRELTRDASIRGSTLEAVHWADQLAGQPTASFDDQLLRLNLCRAAGMATSGQVEANLAAHSVDHPSDAAEYLTWLLVQGRARDALEWTEKLPVSTRAAPGIRAVTADCFAALQDWDRFFAALHQGAWGRLPEEPMKLAFSAWTLSQRDRPVLAHEIWKEALTASKTNLSALRVLLRLAGYWRWSTEADETLLEVARSFPDETWALTSLVSSAYARKDTAMLKTAYGIWHENDPSNRRVTGDWAMLMLLLEPTARRDQAKESARILHEENPHNPFFATTYAFALYQQNQSKAAITMMELLRPAELTLPGRALYYGVFLAADGQLTRAKISLKLADLADMLPPERDLLRQAWALVGEPSVSKNVATRL